MKLSIILVNYNVKYFLEQCLHSVWKARAGIDSEIWIVDNNSVDGSVEMVQKKFPDVKIISNKSNVGFSKANNQAIRESSGEYVLLLNPDTVVEEDTFKKILGFMDAHPEAGGLGVKMIDGKGKFLPESKRGLPTPAVAFYKMSGLAKLFPLSQTFGKYHLSYLANDKTHSVDVLAGAFMLIRRSVLDQTGLLDEDFFMYGEDIDMSYRITKAGYKNYYFPETRIIHYKGESTRKSSVNYVFVFYNAMIIFARKHFSRSRASVFSVLIKIAIYVRASVSVLIRFFRKAILPMLDAGLLFAGMYFLKNYWGKNMVVHYPPEYMLMAVPAYLAVWILSVYLSGGYDQPVRLSKVTRGIVTGTVLILVGYALLPEDMRFSRALILLGSVWAAVAMLAMRLLLNLVPVTWFTLEKQYRKRLLIVADPEEGTRVLSLLQLSGASHNIIGFAGPSQRDVSSVNGQADDYRKYYLGNTDIFRELLDIYKIDEVIFCARDVASNEIISLMSSAGDNDVEYKIAPPESLFIIGSSSIDNPGELYVVDINSISRSVNKRNKRMIDILFSVLFLAFSPVLVLFQKHPAGFFENIFRVLSGRNSWVGYYSMQTQATRNPLPVIKPGILTPLDSLNRQHLDADTIHRLNGLYAKDYRVYSDISILMQSWKKLEGTLEGRDPDRLRDYKYDNNNPDAAVLLGFPCYIKSPNVSRSSSLYPYNSG